MKIYYYKINANDEEERISKALSVLSAEERQRAKKFRFKSDFYRYVAGKIMTRRIISEWTGEGPENIEFRTDKYDRPFLKHPVKNLDFNISHSGDYVALVVGGSRAGIDVEMIKPIDFNMAEDCFHDREIEYLFSRPQGRQERFFRIWTLKESFIKAIGHGLSYPLKNFYFDIKPDNEININIVGREGGGKIWNFRVYDMLPGHKLAVCTMGATPPAKPVFLRDLSSSRKFFAEDK